MKAELIEDVTLIGCGVLPKGSKYPVITYNRTTVAIRLREGVTAKIPRGKVLLHGKGFLNFYNAHCKNSKT